MDQKSELGDSWELLNQEMCFIWPVRYFYELGPALKNKEILCFKRMNRKTKTEFHFLLKTGDLAMATNG